MITRGQIGTEVTEIVKAADRASSPVRRTLEEMKDLIRPGARAIATLTVIARSQDWQFEPLIKALEEASQIKDWSHPFMVAHNLKEGVSFRWRDAPYNFYASFEDFYDRELKAAFGQWDTLKDILARIVAGTTTDAEGKAEVQAAAERAQQDNVQDKQAKEHQPHGGVREGAGRPSKNAQQDFKFDNKKRDIKLDYPPTGTSAAHAHRVLRTKRPDIHQRVLDGELSPHAGMIEAGFRKKRERKKLTTLEKLASAVAKLTDDEWHELSQKENHRRGRLL
jgi:hypothetical protein